MMKKYVFTIMNALKLNLIFMMMKINLYYVFLNVILGIISKKIMTKVLKIMNVSQHVILHQTKFMIMNLILQIILIKEMLAFLNALIQIKKLQEKIIIVMLNVTQIHLVIIFMMKQSMIIIHVKNNVIIVKVQNKKYMEIFAKILAKMKILKIFMKMTIINVLKVVNILLMEIFFIVGILIIIYAKINVQI